MSPAPSSPADGEIPRWQTPRARITSVLSLLLLGAVGTRGALAQSATVVVAFVVFALLTVGLTLWRPTDHRVAVSRLAPLGVYFAVVGFDLFGAGHNYFIGGAGIFWLLFSAAGLLGAIRVRSRADAARDQPPHNNLRTRRGR